MKAGLTRTGLMVATCAGLCLLAASAARAHCDTLSGPVVQAARMALEKGDVTPVLKWVKKEDEKEIRAAFEKTLAVRAQGAEARELADTYFFETLVRLHRAGEGAAYTGLKPAGTDLGPAIPAADRALDTGSVDALVKLLTEEVAAGVRQRFSHALEAKRSAEASVEAGRRFVAAYVEFMHYVERVHAEATGTAASHEHAASAARGGHKH